MLPVRRDSRRRCTSSSKCTHRRCGLALPPSTHPLMCDHTVLQIHVSLVMPGHIGTAIAKKGGLEKLQQEIRSKDRVRVKTLKTDEEYHVLKQGQAWKKMEHTELRRFAKHLLVPATRNPTALELIKNIGKALAKEKKKGKKQ